MFGRQVSGGFDYGLTATQRMVTPKGKLTRRATAFSMASSGHSNAFINQVLPFSSSDYSVL